MHGLWLWPLDGDEATVAAGEGSHRCHVGGSHRRSVLSQQVQCGKGGSMSDREVMSGSAEGASGCATKIPMKIIYVLSSFSCNCR